MTPPAIRSASLSPASSPEGTRRECNAPAAASDLAGEPGSATVRPSFDQIYADYAQFVWRSLRRLGVAESQLSDAVQDSFLVVHRRLADFEGRSSIKTWVFGIAMRVASEYVRRRPIDRFQPLSEGVPDQNSRGPLDSATRAEAVRELELLLAEMSPEQRAVFILAELEQMTVGEIAIATGASPHTVASRLKASRARFEQSLERHRARDGWRFR